MSISFVIMGRNSKLALADGEEVVAIEDSPFCPKDHPDPTLGFVTENKIDGRILAFWTNETQCKDHFGLRLHNMKFNSVDEAREFIKTQCPGQYGGSFTFRVCKA